MPTTISMPGDKAVEPVTTEVVEPENDVVESEEDEIQESYDDEEGGYEDVGEALGDVPPETEVWTGGPTAGETLEWIEKHGGVYVTSISFEEHYAWRRLKRSEYARISSQLETAAAQNATEAELTMLNEELICMTCVLSPKIDENEIDNLLAGIPTLLSQHILERSGFTAIGMREMF